MKSISSSKNTTLLLVIALVMALLFALYYYVVKPKQDDVQTMNNEVSYLKNEVASLEQSLVVIKEQQFQTSETEYTLRKKMPNNRAIDSLILNMEEIEFVTGTRIQSIDFNNYDVPVSSSGLLDPNNTTSEAEEQQETNAESTEETQESASLPVSTIAVENLPPALKLITFNINVTSPNYENLQQFIKEIEQIERVMHIDTIDFTLPGEEAEIIGSIEDVVSADVQVTTFYYE